MQTDAIHHHMRDSAQIDFDTFPFDTDSGVPVPWFRLAIAALAIADIVALIVHNLGR